MSFHTNATVTAAMRSLLFHGRKEYSQNGGLHRTTYIRPPNIAPPPRTSTSCPLAFGPLDAMMGFRSPRSSCLSSLLCQEKESFVIDSYGDKKASDSLTHHGCVFV
jgi:hypothetical protein